jgi:hypothetical protein
MKVIDSLLNIIEMYITEIKEKKILLNEKTVETISMIFLWTGSCGSDAGAKEEKNKFRNYFDENNRLNVLVNFFKYLISQTLLSLIQEETINNISVAICFLLKSEEPPPCYGYILEISNRFRRFSFFAKEAWDKMLKADECLLRYWFKKVTVAENFEVENGVLGLGRDIYLSIVRFLHPSIVRKV